MLSEIKNWLILVSFLSFVTFFSWFFDLYEQKFLTKELLFTNHNNFNFVHEKIPINKAKMSDLLKIDKISHYKALLVLSFIKDNNINDIDKLLEIKGIGPKTLAKIKDYFY